MQYLKIYEIKNLSSLHPNTETIQLNELKNGVYFVRYTTQERTTTIRVIKN